MLRVDDRPYTPTEVSAVEYLRGVSRAVKQAGLTPMVSHIDTAIHKLLAEQEIPKLRVLQILNRLQESVADNKDTVTISVADLRLILQSNKFKV